MLYLELIIRKIENLLFYNKFAKRIKHKKCKGCQYLIDKGDLCCCSKSNIYIEPLKFFCKDKNTFQIPRRNFLLRKEDETSYGTEKEDYKIKND